MADTSSSPLPVALRAVSVGAARLGVAMWTLAIAGVIELGDSYVEGRIAVRLLGLAGLFSIAGISVTVLALLLAAIVVAGIAGVARFVADLPF